MAPAPTRRPFHPLPRFAVLLAALALVPAGCGLSDYEGQMANEAALVRLWEKEDKLLGEPLRMPEFPKKDGKLQPTWSVFLRPPLGVNTTPVPQQNSKLTQMMGPLAQYTAKGNSFGMQYVYLGVGTDPNEFPAAVYTQFGASAGGESSVAVKRSAVLLSGTGKETISPDITLKRKTFDGPSSHYSFNFYQVGKSQVAVVYQMDKAAAAKAREVIEASLSTLGAGGEEVSVLRDGYRSRNSKGK